MKQKWFAAMAFLCVMTSSQITLAQDLVHQLAGSWKQTSVVHKYVESGVVNSRNTSGVIMFSYDGLFAITLVAGSFFGSGTFKVEGDVVVLRYELCSQQSWIGQERRSSVQVANKVLTWTSAQLVDSGGKAYHETYTLERIE
jgi:hypothetical protein